MTRSDAMSEPPPMLALSRQGATNAEDLNIFKNNALLNPSSPRGGGDRIASPRGGGRDASPNFGL